MLRRNPSGSVNGIRHRALPTATAGSPATGCRSTLCSITRRLELADLARAFPDVPIILNHIGCPLGIGVYAGKRDAVFKNWQRDLRTLAACPNAVVKLGGMGMHFLGFGFENLPLPPSSDDLVKAWRPYVDARCSRAISRSTSAITARRDVERVQEARGVLQRCRKRPSCSSTPDAQWPLKFIISGARSARCDAAWRWKKRASHGPAAKPPIANSVCRDPVEYAGMGASGSCKLKVRSRYSVLAGC